MVDAQGRLIAHPDISLVLRNTDMTRLAQVKAARAAAAGVAEEPLQEAEDIRGRQVLTAYAPVTAPGWLVFVELPREEAYAPLIDSIERSGLLLLLGLALAVLAGIFLARRMVVPIQALQAGAERIGSGDLGQRISIKTGDELESLADQFNDMAGKLEESYADLEQKVEDRTRELSESLEQQTATSEVLRVISSSPGELEPVFAAMLANATKLCEASYGTMWLSAGDGFRIAAMHGPLPAAFIEQWGSGALLHPGPDVTLARVGQSSSSAIQIADLRRDKSYLSGDPIAGCGGRHRRHPHIGHGTDAQGGRAGRGDRHLPPGGAPIHREADRAGRELRRPGRHRHRERPPAQRIARPHDRAGAIGRGAARARRGQPGGQLDARSRDRAAHDRRQGGAALGHRGGRDLRVRRGER